MRLATNVLPTPPFPWSTKCALRIGLFLSGEEAGSEEPIDLSFFGDRAVSEGASRLLICGMGWWSVLWCDWCRGNRRRNCLGTMRRRGARIAQRHRRLPVFGSGLSGVPTDELAEAAIADTESCHVALVDRRHRPAGGKIRGNHVEPGKQGDSAGAPWYPRWLAAYWRARFLDL